MDDAEEEVKAQDGEETNERKARFGPSKWGPIIFAAIYEANWGKLCGAYLKHSDQQSERERECKRDRSYVEGKESKMNIYQHKQKINDQWIP